jgi:flagellar biosynthetic protein FliO
VKPAKPRSSAPPGAPPADPAPDTYSFGEALSAAEGRPPQSPWRRLVAQYGTRNIAIGTGIIVLVLAAFALPTGQQGDPFDGPGAAVDIILKLGAVLALAYVALAALKRYTNSKVSQRGALIEVLDSTMLAPNRSVYVIRAGSKRLVLGVTQTQITALAELPDSPADALDALADDDDTLLLP